jgi:type IV secretion system protein VirB11
MADRDLLLSLAGPLLASYLTEGDTTEVMANDNGTCYLSRFGVGTVEVAHPGWDALDRFLSAIAHEVGQEWRATSPRLSAALEDLGWRVQAGRPPLAPAPFMALRKHPHHIFPLSDFEAKGILTAQERAVLEQAMQERKRLVIAGGVGSAKTSLLNALLDSIKESPDRVILVEDAPELHCAVRNCTRMRVVKGQWTLRDLVQDTLRLNPSRLIVGEVRGGEALDMLKAFQTGHSGLTTLHVDEAAHTMHRLEQLVQEVSVSPQQALIGEVIDMVVHMAKHGPSWRCTGILAIEGCAQGAYRMTPLTGKDVT